MAEEREGRPIAKRAAVAPGRRTSEAASAAISNLHGWLLSTSDVGFSAALIKSGARPRRLASLMQCDVRSAPRTWTIDPPWELCSLPTDPLAWEWEQILPSWRAAFPADHPDHFDGEDAAAIAFMMRIDDGSEVGRTHRSSTLLARDGRVLAGIAVTIRDEEPPWGGPWIADIWRDPELRGTGVGQQLIRRSMELLHEDGFQTLGLAVSAGNPARQAYVSCGFRLIEESQTVLLPD